MDPILPRLADSFTAATTLEELARPLLELLEAVTGLESTYLTAIDLENGLQHVVFARNRRELRIPEGLSVPWQDTLCRRALDEGRMFTDDVAGCWGDSDAARELGIATYVSVPVRIDDGELYGTLCAASSTTTPLPDDAGKVMEMFSRLIGQYIERERLLSRLQLANARLSASALVDPVTALPNRRALFEELARMLARARRDGTAVVVAFLDLDGFKAVNDAYGHEAGDQLLAAVGQRITASRRAGDLVARLGGDEFVVLAPVDREMAGQAAEVIRTSLVSATRGHYRVCGIDLDYAGASVGVATSGQSDASPQTLVSQADAAMFREKRARRAA